MFAYTTVMQEVALASALAFAFAGTFSPGPNNVMSGTLGIMRGYRRALPFIIGITIGFGMVLVACALASTTLLRIVPDLEPVLRWIGAAYILWLAAITWIKRDQLGGAVDADVSRVHGFVGGFALQFINVKSFVYGLLMYSTFLAGLSGNRPALAVSVLVLALLGFASTTTWALGGVAIRRWLHTARDRAVVAALLALTLAWTAVELVDVRRLLGL
jgi:cysteine/O-acetylserine efflux protein